MSKPSEEAMGIARGHVDHASDCHNYRLNSDDQDDAECELVSCEFKAMSESLALAIDALVQRKVEEERERCCRAVCRYCSEGNQTRPARDYDQPMHLFQGYPPRTCSASAIRTPPPATRGGGLDQRRAAQRGYALPRAARRQGGKVKLRLCIECHSATRYLPYVLCRDCLRAERERERRAFERRLFDVRFEPANEHGHYTHSDGKAEGKEA